MIASEMPLQRILQTQRRKHRHSKGTQREQNKPSVSSGI